MSAIVTLPRGACKAPDEIDARLQSWMRSRRLTLATSVGCDGIIRIARRATMHCPYACGSSEHRIARRAFLGGAISGAGIFGGGLLGGPLLAREVEAHRKQVLVVFLHGGVSQLESWDPKPRTDTGGPFRAIPTSVPGIHISELLPFTAKQMHRLALVRSVNTKENDHGKGRYLMETGRRKSPAADYPHLGAVCSRMLAEHGSGLPGNIQISFRGGGSRANDAAYLGPAHASVILSDGKPPQHLARAEGLDAPADLRRQSLRQAVDERFFAGRRTAATTAYAFSFDQAASLMERRDVFDVTKEPEQDRDRYGKHDFGQHCLLARRLLENGVAHVQVLHSNYDTHYENFDFHIEQLGEFDRPFATLMEDLAQRGLLETTLVVVMSEFGRTPKINDRYGRDHWGNAWSVALGGCGIQAGAVIGKTNPKGTAVADREVDHANLFHTYLQAVGIDSTSPIEIDGRPTPLADPAAQPIRELLA
jgi:uncharacterized protein (DUF1501 family)